jgi:hypothetical protein
MTLDVGLTLYVQRNCIAGLLKKRNVNNAYVACHLQALCLTTHRSAILILKKVFHIVSFLIGRNL